MSFWHIPDDLLPGPTKEDRYALGLPLPRLARFRSVHRSLFSRMHAGGRGLRQFVEPIASRWHRRNLCPCDMPATMRCTVHGSKLCGDMLCVGMHRWALGDCKCSFESPLSPLDYAIRSLAVIVTGLAVALVALYLGVQL